MLGRGAGEPKLATAYNEYAWLVANTTGDFDRALARAQMANEIRPSTAGYLDTLAHCYYAKGDLDSAVATQRRANVLEPNSGAIARQLRFFEQALAQRTPPPQSPEP
jgi:tetratricopeptide (TPR) repeat protein